mmetsp:Transcript_3720/g.9617  ORF Transcript_3720/g.9617 Transcript_3720/m.9617 type:complete len:274 (+) Transcript_3720:277-1098(+)
MLRVHREAGHRERHEGPGVILPGAGGVRASRVWTAQGDGEDVVLRHPCGHGDGEGEPVAPDWEDGRFRLIQQQGDLPRVRVYQVTARSARSVRHRVPQRLNVGDSSNVLREVPGDGHHDLADDRWALGWQLLQELKAEAHDVLTARIGRAPDEVQRRDFEAVDDGVPGHIHCGINDLSEWVADHHEEAVALRNGVRSRARHCERLLTRRQRTRHLELEVAQLREVAAFDGPLNRNRGEECTIAFDHNAPWVADADDAIGVNLLVRDEAEGHLP